MSSSTAGGVIRPTETATVTVRVGDMPNVATADSYTLQTLEGAVSLVLRHGSMRWSEPIPEAVSSTGEPVGVRMTGKQFQVLSGIFETSPPGMRISLTLGPETSGLTVATDRWCVRIGATRVVAVVAETLPKSRPTVPNLAQRHDALQEGLELVARVQMATAELPKGIAAMMPELSAPLAEIDTLAGMVQRLIEAEMTGAKVEGEPVSIPG
jgi:hypothetical protein